MTYDIGDLGRATEHLTHKVSNLTEAVEDNLNKEENSAMNTDSIAGLLALMQGNRGMDLPGLLALCKEKGYDRSFGNEFLFVFLLLALFANGGFGGFNRENQAAFASMAGNNCQDIIGLHDRIADSRSVSQMGFQQLQTWLCESIANVTNAVRNQGDRAVDTARNVGDTVRSCCCTLEAALASLNCKVDGVERTISENSNLINAKIELEALKAENARSAMECRIIQNQKDCCCEMNQRFDRLECTLQTNRLADENARLARENAALSDILRERKIADSVVDRMESFQLAHYTPTRTGSSS